MPYWLGRASVPTYDYRCGSCEHRHEAMQGILEEPLKDCPSCGKPDLRRLISSGCRPIFKGSGFYETDYKRKGAT